MSMENVTSARTQFVVQADKGKSEWYDFAISSSEDVGWSNLAHANSTRQWERHRLVRRLTYDVELKNP